MMRFFQQILSDLTYLFFPRVCVTCGKDLSRTEEMLCVRCQQKLPYTYFHTIPDNPVEKVFWGRVPISHATACLYFSKDGMVQHLIHELKYKGRKDLAQYMGRIMGQVLDHTKWLGQIDALVPVPLFAAREKKRGYNQSTLLCKGIATLHDLPIYTELVKREKHTDTQTHRTRIDRWENMQGAFSIIPGKQPAHQHLLLVDDVLTTGATLESCAATLLSIPGVRVSICTLAMAHG